MAQQNKKQQQLIVGLIIVAVLLVVVIVVLVATKPQSTATTATDQAQTATSTATAADMSGKTNAGTGTSADTSTFDPSNATKVPSGEQPTAFVEAYYKAVAAGNYQGAYQYLPQATKEGQSVADFESALKGYSITGYTMGQSNTSGSNMTIEADEQTAYGTFTTIWTFVQQNGAWLLKSKAVAGMQ